MSEISKKLLPTAQRVVESSRLNLQVDNLTIFRIVKRSYHDETYKEIEEICELVPGIQIFVEATVEHTRIGKFQLLMKGFVDKNGELQFVHVEMPIVPIEPNSTTTDKCLKKDVREFMERYQAYLATVTSSILNLSISVMKKVGETKKRRV